MSDTLPDGPGEGSPGAEAQPARAGATRVDDGFLRPTSPDLGQPEAAVADPGTVDEAPRETVPDTQPEPAPRGRGKLVAIAVVVLGGLGVVVSLALYWFVFRYEHRAHLHVPGNATLAARIELAELAAFPPVRKRLLEARERQSKDGKNLAEKVRKATGVSPTDLREAVLATVDGKSWVAVLGGRLSKGRVVQGLREVLEGEGVADVRVEDGLLVSPRGVVGQAEDGSIVAGTDVPIVKAALPAAAEESPRLRLPATRAVAFVATQELWTGVAWNTSLPNAMALRKIARAEGDLSLGDKPSFDVRFEVQKGESAAEVAKDLEGMLTALKLAMLFAKDDLGARAIVGGAQVTVEGEVVRLRAPWPVDEIEKGMGKFLPADP